jgi:peroxiredoxin/glutaredoxin
MSLQDKTGQRVPEVTFQTRQGHQWKSLSTNEIFAGKKVVVFSLPGAYTPTCSSSHLPRYNQLFEAFKAQGIDTVACLSVNDSFVMNAWKDDQKADNLLMIPDGNGEFSEKLGFLVDKEDLGFGKRSWRYSMLVNDGVIEKMFIESEKPGDPFSVSDADTMLEYLGGKVPASITVFTRPGCSFCFEAKELLKSKQLNYEELELNRDYSIQTLKAVSNKLSFPQIFINGEYIGGADELKNFDLSKL